MYLFFFLLNTHFHEYNFPSSVMNHIIPYRYITINYTVNTVLILKLHICFCFHLRYSVFSALKFRIFFSSSPHFRCPVRRHTFHQGQRCAKFAPEPTHPFTFKPLIFGLLSLVFLFTILIIKLRRKRQRNFNLE